MGEPTFVLVKGTAGMGNRMLSALNGFLYAKLTGRVPIIDWTDWHFSPDGSNLFPRLFDSPEFHDLPELPQTTSVTPPVWNGKLNFAAADIVGKCFPDLLGHHSSVYPASITAGRLDYPEQIAILWSWDQQIWRMRKHFKGEFEALRRKTDWEILRELAARHFVLRPDIRSQIDDFKSRFWKSPMLGVHIRHTDRRSPLPTFHKVVQELLKKEANQTIFLATDNESVSRGFSNTYPNVVTRDKRFRPGGGAIHQEYDYDDKLGRTIDAIVEMFLLSECDRLVYARRSTFSLVAHALSAMPPDRAVDIDSGNLVLYFKSMTQRHISPVLHAIRHGRRPPQNPRLDPSRQPPDNSAMSHRPMPMTRMR